MSMRYDYLDTILYPQGERNIFTDREDVLKKLEVSLERVKAGEFRGFLFIGIRRCGKTLILKEFLKRIIGDPSIKVFYVDCESIPRQPDIFTDRLMSWFVYWCIERGRGTPERYMNLENLPF